jgi:acetyltransferase-like isoleucine patch superfamily enzyme
MRLWIKARLANRPVVNHIASLLWHRPFFALPAIIYSAYLTHRLTRRFFPLRVLVVNKLLRVEIHRSVDSRIELAGRLLVESWHGGVSPIFISVGPAALLKVEGDFVIGHGVQIVIGATASLLLGGRKSSTGSGITCDSRIIVGREVSVGYDSIIAWGVVISDSDWHAMNGIVRQSRVTIGNHVWIAHDVSVLRGARIGNGCVIGAKSLVQDQEFSDGLLVAGVPARVIKENISWSR